MSSGNGLLKNILRPLSSSGSVSGLWLAASSARLPPRTVDSCPSPSVVWLMPDWRFFSVEPVLLCSLSIIDTLLLLLLLMVSFLVAHLVLLARPLSLRLGSGCCSPFAMLTRTLRAEPVLPNGARQSGPKWPN